MKIIRNINMNLKMTFTNYGFYICTAFTIILCFGTGIYRDTLKNDEYSVIKSLMVFDREFMLNNTNFCSYNVAIKGAGSWLTMFIPIISAFAFIPLVCDESESKFIRNSIFRSSKFSFHISKFLTACISGGLAVMIGYILFTAAVYMLFPNISEYAPEVQEIYKETILYSYPRAAEHGLMSALMTKYAEMFIYGAVSATPSVMLTGLMRNKYLVMCIPFFLKYAVTQTSVKLSARAFRDWQNPDMKLSKLASVISPDALLGVFASQYMLQIFLYNGALLLFAFLFYMIVCGRRLDCGE